MVWNQVNQDYEPAVDMQSGTSTSYGDGFASGFAAFRESGDFSDVCVLFSGREHHLHSLMLAYHSLFFRRAFSNGMRETSQRRLELSFLEDPLDLLPLVIDYFYEGHIMLSDTTCFGVLALARHLLVPKLEHYCRDFINSRLDIAQCIQFLLQGLQYSDEQLQEDCIALFARSFATSYCQTAAGLPPEVIKAILNHEALQVQCEAQVLLFVLDYIDSTQIDAAVAAQLFQHVRLCYLSNERLVWLQQQSPSPVPSGLLLQGTMQRLQFQDQSNALSEAPVQPRYSYCSKLHYGLPGGQEHVDVPVHHIWDLLAAKIRVKVSGVITAYHLACCHAGSSWNGAVRNNRTTRDRQHSSKDTDGSSCKQTSKKQAQSREKANRVSFKRQQIHTRGLQTVRRFIAQHRSTTGCRHATLVKQPISTDAEVVTPNMDCLETNASTVCEGSWHAGVSEGRPRSVVAGSGEGEDRWFCTTESAHPAPWIELHLPCNVTLLSLQNYTFTHGHHRSSYYRMQKWESQAGSTSCMRPGAKFHSLPHKQEGSQQQGNDYLVTLADWTPPKQDWRVLRLVGTGPQQDGVHRLSIKDVKLYGTVRIDLMEQAEGLAITKEQIQTAQTKASTGTTPYTRRPRALLQSPTRTMPPVTQSLYHNQF